MCIHVASKYQTNLSPNVPYLMCNTNIRFPFESPYFRITAGDHNKQMNPFYLLFFGLYVEWRWTWMLYLLNPHRPPPVLRTYETSCTPKAILLNQTPSMVCNNYKLMSTIIHGHVRSTSNSSNILVPLVLSRGVNGLNSDIRRILLRILMFGY